jgi:hypothetical protein
MIQKRVKIMKSISANVIVISSIGLLFLGACSNTNQANNSSSNPTTSPAIETSKTTASPATPTSETAATLDHSKPKKGGQVVEAGNYHLEFVTDKGDNGNHLDLYLLKGEAHEPVSNAKVTAQVQLPDGKEKTLDLKYDLEGKHYAALLPETASGQYQVKITADVNGEKVNGRFSFNQCCQIYFHIHHIVMHGHS